MAELGTPSGPLSGLLLEEEVLGTAWSRRMSRQILRSEAMASRFRCHPVKVAVLPQTNKLDVVEGRNGSWQLGREGMSGTPWA